MMVGAYGIDLPFEDQGMDWRTLYLSNSFEKTYICYIPTYIATSGENIEFSTSCSQEK